MKKRPFLSGAILGLLLAAATPLSTFAVEETDFNMNTTRDLYDLCSVKDDNPNYLPAHWACRGFLEGAVQYHDGVSDQEHLKRLICYPATATIADGKVFLGGMDDTLGILKCFDEVTVFFWEFVPF